MSLSSYAANWMMITEGQSGSRLLVDTETFSIQKDNNIPFVGALFRFFDSNEGYSTPFAYVIEMSSCRNRNGRLLVRARENNVWVTKQEFFFSAGGTKVYDKGALFLCDTLEYMAKESKKDGI